MLCGRRVRRAWGTDHGALATEVDWRLECAVHSGISQPAYSVKASFHCCSISALTAPKLFLAQPHIAHYLHQYSPSELFSRMHRDYCGPAIGVLHNEVAASLPDGLKTDLAKSLDYDLSFNRFQLRQLALQQSCSMCCILPFPDKAK